MENTLKEIILFLIEELEFEHYDLANWALKEIEERWNIKKEFFINDNKN